MKIRPGVFAIHDSWPQAERAKQRGLPVLQLTADHNAQWSAPAALVKMLADSR
jgi:hypothetical protein